MLGTRCIGRCRGTTSGLKAAIVICVTIVAVGVMATAAYARVEFVTQGACPRHGKQRCFHKIQEAVERTTPGSWVLIAPGIYDEEVKIKRAAMTELER